jgi:uncharacterized protein YmfQ (DUF2313 family)
VLTKVLAAAAEEFARFDARVETLLTTELDPGQTSELLSEWEELCGLPDDCSPETQTEAERRVVVQQRLIARGGQSQAYFIEQAELLGWTASIEEYAPADCGSDCEAALNPDEATEADCESDCESYLRVEGWRFVWTLALVEEVSITEVSCEDSCEDALASWGDGLLECTVRRMAPAHTLVRFTYGE